MLFPKKVKHRKWQRQRAHPDKRGTASRGTELSFGAYGVKATTPARIRANQIESARRVISRTVGKNGRTWIRIFPDRPYTQKAAEVGMGKGKGEVEAYEVEVLPGRVLFEVEGISEEVAREAMRKAGTKLPVKTRFVARR